MSYKVVITGISTADLPHFTARESEEMLRRIKNGETHLREMFLESNIRLVLSMVRRFKSDANTADDLFQVGMLGLIKALDNFDVSLNVRFSTYAVPMITGEIRRFIRESTGVKVGRNLRDIAYKAMQARDKLELANANEASLTEIAEEINVPYGEVVSALDAISEPVSIYESVYNDSDDNLMLVDQLQYLPDDILVKVDRTGMAVSLENRIPLLDKRIVEFAWSLPIEYKYRNGVSKKLMRNVLYKYVPRELIDRPKQGFAFPALRWITETEELRQWTDELFNSTSFRDAVIINKNIPLKMWKSHLAGKEAGHILWNYIMLLAWAKERDIVL